MRRLFCILSCAMAAFLNAATAPAQSSLEQLEKRLRQPAPADEQQAADQPDGEQQPENADQEGPPAEPQAAGENKRPAEPLDLPARPKRGGGYLGIEIDDQDEEGQGVRIVLVAPNGPAARGGLEFGDLIVAIDGQPVATTADAGDLLKTLSPGTEVAFDLERPQPNGDARPLTVKIKLGKKPTAARGAATLGVRVEAVALAARQALDVPLAKGALVVEVAPDSPAEAAELPLQAVIVSYNGQPVDSPDDLGRFIAGASPGDQARLGYYFDGRVEETTAVLAAANGLAPPRRVRRPSVAKPLPDDKTSALEEKVRELERRVEALEAMLAKQAPPPAAGDD